MLRSHPHLPCTWTSLFSHSVQRSRWSTSIHQIVQSEVANYTDALKWARNEGCVDWQSSLSISAFDFPVWACCCHNLRNGQFACYCSSLRDRTRCRMLCPCMLYGASLRPENLHYESNGFSMGRVKLSEAGGKKSPKCSFTGTIYIR